MANRELQTENFLPLEILNTFCPGGKYKEETTRGMKVSSSPSFSCVFLLGPLFFFSIYHLEAENRIHCNQDLFSVTYLSAHEV